MSDPRALALFIGRRCCWPVGTSTLSVVVRFTSAAAVEAVLVMYSAFGLLVLACTVVGKLTDREELFKYHLTKDFSTFELCDGQKMQLFVVLGIINHDLVYWQIPEGYETPFIVNEKTEWKKYKLPARRMIYMPYPAVDLETRKIKDDPSATAFEIPMYGENKKKGQTALFVPDAYSWVNANQTLKSLYVTVSSKLRASYLQDDLYMQKAFPEFWYMHVSLNFDDKTGLPKVFPTQKDFEKHRFVRWMKGTHVSGCRFETEYDCVTNAYNPDLNKAEPQIVYPLGASKDNSFEFPLRTQPRKVISPVGVTMPGNPAVMAQLQGENGSEGVIYVYVGNDGIPCRFAKFKNPNTHWSFIIVDAVPKDILRMYKPPSPLPERPKPENPRDWSGNKLMEQWAKWYEQQQKETKLERKKKLLSEDFDDEEEEEDYVTEEDM
ncbi:hypothetical protein L596_022361 [Steinernema carpocapsae]|uniref:Uncharacterized protein n=1 Tax=Steinernema carpocapsae TaxID=34508 RepID=A0A4U5MLH9_STECR|nr:hypothetical protein L596_022361 [Steinernema carpocapsae]